MSTYNQPSPTMLYRVDVRTGTGPDVWTQVKGISELVVPDWEGETAEGESADEAGWKMPEVTGRGGTVEITCLRRRTSTTGFTLDQGQAALDAAARGLMEDAVKTIRWYGHTVEDVDAFQWDVSVTSTESTDSGLTDLTRIKYTLEGRGAPTTLTYPVT